MVTCKNVFQNKMHKLQHGKRPGGTELTIKTLKTINFTPGPQLSRPGTKQLGPWPRGWGPLPYTNFKIDLNLHSVWMHLKRAYTKLGF